MKTLLLALAAVGAFTTTAFSQTPAWQNDLEKQLPLLGHRNWIVVADSAYPSQTAPGIKTIYTGEKQLDALNKVLAAVKKQEHVRGVVFIDAELPHVPEKFAKGIGDYRAGLKEALKGKDVTSLPHGEIIEKLDEAGQTFHVLLLKDRHGHCLTRRFSFGSTVATGPMKLRRNYARRLKLRATSRTSLSLVFFGACGKLGACPRNTKGNPMTIDECGCNDNTCDRAVPRREFIKIAGLGAVVGSAAGMPVMAGPFSDENEYLKTIPIDKKLDPQWVKSLYERGEKETYTDPQALGHIGMPVGGIGAGLVYLGGDGRLWMWDVFNKPYPRGFMGRGAGGDTYLKTVRADTAFSPTAFELRLITGDKTETRSLDRDGFAEVTFDGRYPMGIITFHDTACAVTAQLDAFSPFIPLDLENSSYPATVMRYTLKNTSNSDIGATVTGWVDNPVCVHTGRPADTLRRNTIRRGEHAAVLQCTAEKPAAERKIETRPDILFEDFEKSDYANWEVAGEAFGKGPVAINDIPDYQGEVNGVGKTRGELARIGARQQHRRKGSCDRLAAQSTVQDRAKLHLAAHRWRPARRTTTCQGIPGGREADR